MKLSMELGPEELPEGGKKPEPRKMNAKGEIDLSHPEALILDALGLMRFQDVASNKEMPLSKLDLFGGPVKMGAWEAVQEYIASGSRGRLSKEEEHYLDLLNLVFSLDSQYGKRNVIRFLVSPYFGFSYEQASNLYMEAIETFYANRNISKDAMRQKTADQYDALYVAALNVARTAKDFKNAAEILDMKVKVLGLDREDVQMLPKQVYARSWRVLSLDPESIGLAKADRRALKVMIDELTVTGLIPESERKRLDMDTGIIDYDIVERMEDESQAAN